MLTLVFPKDKLTSASIPVRWCVDEETLKLLEATKKKPYIVICVNYDKGFESNFYLYPLDQFSAYVNIYYDGKISIYAFLLVVSNDNKVEQIVDTCFISAYNKATPYPFHSYRVELRTSPEDKEVHSIETFDTSIAYTFEMSSEFFGKEIPEWSKFYVNRYWYRHKPKDQCEQRRRLMSFPFTTMIPLTVEFICRLLWNTFATILFWLCTFKIGPKYILHPFTVIRKDDVQNFNVLIDDIIDLPFFKKHGSTLLALFLVPFIPIVYVILYIVSVLMVHDTLIEGLYRGLMYWYSILAVCCFVFAIYKCLEFVAKKVVEYTPNAIKSIFLFLNDFFESVIEKFILLLDRLFPVDNTIEKRTRELLLCSEKDGNCLPELKIKDKPARLIFADIKHKVCKPMRG